jgi:Carboxypeptidase regulatory-like domain
MRRIKWLLLLSCVVAVAGSTAFGQAVSVGAFEGAITDPSGAVIAGATITATNKATSAERVAATDSGGYYRIAGLNPGVYRIKIEAKNFATQINEDVTLNVGITLTIRSKRSLARVSRSEALGQFRVGAERFGKIYSRFSLRLLSQL